jgi:hypothetical protein
MKHARRLWMMLLALGALTAAVLLFNFLTNPFGAWRHRLVSGVYYRLRGGGHERVMTPYRLRTAAPATVLLGTSRVIFGMPVEQGYMDGFLNAGLSAARPAEIAKEVRLALKNPRLKRIVWMVDFFTFDKRLKCVPETCARLDGSLRLLILDNLLSSDALDAGWHMLGRAISGRRALDRKALEPIPWPQDFICERFKSQAGMGLGNIGKKGALQQILSETPLYKGSVCCGAGLAQLRSAVNEINRAGVELIVFLPPMTQYELEEIRQGGLWPRFQQFKRDLTAAVSYWDYSGYNQISHTDSMFLDVVHMKPEVGMTILRQLLGMPDSDCADMHVVTNSALRVSPENIDQVLALQDARERSANASSNKYAQVVARAIAQGRDDWAGGGVLERIESR